MNGVLLLILSVFSYLCFAGSDKNINQNAFEFKSHPYFFDDGSYGLHNTSNPPTLNKVPTFQVLSTEVLEEKDESLINHRIKRLKTTTNNKPQFATGVLLTPHLVLAPTHLVDSSKKDCGVMVDGVSPDKCFPFYRPKDSFRNNPLDAATDFTVLGFGHEKAFNTKGMQKYDSFLRQNELLKFKIIGFGEKSFSPINIGVDEGSKAGKSGGDYFGIGGGSNEHSQAEPKLKECVLNLKNNNVMFIENGVFKLVIDKNNLCGIYPGHSGSPLIDQENNTIIGFASRAKLLPSNKLEVVFISASQKNLLQFIDDKESLMNMVIYNELDK